MDPIDLEEMIRNDKKDIVCRLGTVLTLKNSSFPYPPGRDFDIILSDIENIRVESICTRRDTGVEGGRSHYIEKITFQKPGQYKIKIKELGSGKNEGGYKFYFVDVIVV